MASVSKSHLLDELLHEANEHGHSLVVGLEHPPHLLVTERDPTNPVVGDEMSLLNTFRPCITVDVVTPPWMRASRS